VRSAVAAGCAAAGALNAIAAAAVSSGPAVEPNPATARVAGRFGCPVASVAAMIAAGLAITRVSLQARAGTFSGGPAISGLFPAVITLASPRSCTPPAPLTRVLARTNLITDRPALTCLASSRAETTTGRAAAGPALPTRAARPPGGHHRVHGAADPFTVKGQAMNTGSLLTPWRLPARWARRRATTHLTWPMTQERSP
jgi:hypothetical protein